MQRMWNRTGTELERTLRRPSVLFLTMPPETSNRVIGFDWRKNSALRRGSIRIDETFVPTNRFVGTKT